MVTTKTHLYEKPLINDNCSTADHGKLTIFFIVTIGKTGTLPHILNKNSLQVNLNLKGKSYIFLNII